MKKLLFLIVVSCACSMQKVSAQTDEIIQLTLNIEKLNQFKQILSDMKAGYDVLEKGYGTIKNISEGNFNMHQVFLDGLYQVSPTVQQYGRVADIISAQIRLVSEYKSAYDRFRTGGMFQPGEISYISGVYDRLFSASLHNLDELTTVIMANKLQMSDDERIRFIDRIYADMDDKLHFLRKFNNSTSVLAIQRKKALNENQTIQKNYGIN